uniref:Uncharacterized protein n=1 Tax=Streptomyces sp. F2 TaxID=317660 RepID=V9QGA6_9ACTN|nr:hypothetical protein [Streptomyces sp. F2]AHC28140.1 hypothetical protein pFP3.38 [Streptomyces sp. F2]
MYGARRTALIDRVVRFTEGIARTGRLFARLAAGQTDWSPTGLYAAAMTARFMAAHELIGRAEAQVDDDPDVDLVQVCTPLWFGSTTLYEEN